MSRVRLPILVIAAVLFAVSAVQAADYQQPAPPPVYQPPPPADCCAVMDNWYLRGFVGAGIGASYNTIHDFKDTCSIVSVCTGGSVATGKDNSKWNFAWALHAGVAYKVTNAFAVELAYRYVNLGDASSGDLVAYNGTNQRFNPMEFRGITSHDFKLGRA